VQLFEIVVIEYYGFGIHLWLGLRTLFWLRVFLYLKIFVKEEKKCLLLESAPSSLWTIWLRPISSVERLCLVLNAVYLC